MYINIPDKTTRSFVLKPFDANDAFNAVMLAIGGGKSAKAFAKVDTRPSLRPVGTFQYGPLI